MATLITPTVSAPRQFDASAWKTVLLVSAVGGSLAILRVRHLLAGSFDLGFYIQALYAIRSGTWVNSLFGFGVFSDHVSPVLLPLALLTPSEFPGEFLVLAQAVAVGLGVIPIGKLGQVLGGRRGTQLARFWYAASAAVWYALMFDFHPVTLSLPFGAWVLLELEKGANGRPWLPLMAMPLLREDIALLYGLVVLVAGIRSRRRSWSLVGAGAMTIGAIYFLVMRLQPGLGNHFWYRYRGDISEIPGRLLRPDVLVSLAAVLVPLLVVPPLRGWRRSWPGLLLLASFVLAAVPQQASLYYQYFGQAVPFLIAGALPVVSKQSAARIRLSVTASLAIFVLLGPVVYLGYGPPDRFASVIVAADERSEAREILSAVTPDQSVSATDFLAPAVAWRKDVHPFPGPMICGNSIGYHTPSTRTTDFVLYEPETALAGADWERFLNEWGYVRIRESRGIELWKLDHVSFEGQPCPSWEDQREAVRESE
jgi:uncharacterized membrane protein